MVEIIGESILRCRISTADAEAAWNGHHELSINTAAQSFSVSLGAEAADRMIVLAGGGVTNNRTVSSVTIDTGSGAEAMTIHAQSLDAGMAVGGVDITLFIASKLVPTGTSATVTVTYSGLLSSSFIDVFRLTNLLSTSPYATAHGSGEPPADPSTTINVPSGGVLIGTFAGSYALTGTEFGDTAWTGIATEVSDEALGDAQAVCSSAFEIGASAQTARPVSATNLLTGRKSILVSSWY